MNKKDLFLILLGAILLLPTVVFGQTIGSMAVAVKNQVLVVGAAVVIIFWVATGILFLTAQGEPAGITKAKTALFAAIAGTIIIILANVAWNFVAGSFGIAA
jgi:phosphoglycerol transferase MdoB-like AlkP superfamily enzyme